MIIEQVRCVCRNLICMPAWPENTSLLSSFGGNTRVGLTITSRQPKYAAAHASNINLAPTLCYSKSVSDIHLCKTLLDENVITFSTKHVVESIYFIKCTTYVLLEKNYKVKIIDDHMIIAFVMM